LGRSGEPVSRLKLLDGMGNGFGAGTVGFSESRASFPARTDTHFHISRAHNASRVPANFWHQSEIRGR